MEINKATACYKNGCNCAQAVLVSNAEKLGLSQETAMKVGAGFGGGMNIAGTCGAVIGAVAAIGAKHGSDDVANMDAKKKVSHLTRTFIKEFEEKNSSLVCMELKKVHRKDCNELVKDADEILNKMI